VVVALVMIVLMAMVAAPVIKKLWYVWELLHLGSYQRWLKKASVVSDKRLFMHVKAL